MPKSGTMTSGSPTSASWRRRLLNGKLDNKIVGQSEGKRFMLTATDGSIVRFELGKLDATRNYLQWWLGQDLEDKGYIIFDVSRNV